MDMMEWTQAFLMKLHCTGPCSSTFLLCLLRDSSILHGSWKIIRAPFKIYLFFLGFPLYSLQRFCALCCFWVAADVLSPFRTQTKSWDNSYTFVSFAQNSGGLFLPLRSWPPGDGFFAPHLSFVDTLPYIKKHIISFNQFSQFVVNEPDKKLLYHKWPGYLSWDFSAAPFCFNELCLFSLTLSGGTSSSLC